MAAASLDITVEQGATFSMQLTFNDATPLPIDVSAWTFTGQIRTKYDAPAIIASFTFTAGVSSNQKIVTLTDIVTEGIPVAPASNYKSKPTFYAYDIFAALPGGVADKILTGTASVVPAVTK